MSELLFPVAAFALIFLVVIPALTLASFMLLRFWRRRETVWVRFGSNATFALLVAPVFLPLVWLASSAVHQSTPSSALDACLLDHVGMSHCLDALSIIGMLALCFVGLAVRRALREQPSLKLDLLQKDHEHQARVSRLIQSHARLQGLRVLVVQGTSDPVFTSGWFRSTCYLDACFVAHADDKMLISALLHEAAHIQSHDSLRCSLVRLSLALNPAAALLSADFLRWRQAREACCDSEAVHHGGEALALAESIVQAAKFRCSGPLHCGLISLCGHDLQAIKLRVSLLFEGPPRPEKSAGHVFLMCALLACLVLPHLSQTAYLDHFHLAVESLFHSSF